MTHNTTQADEIRVTSVTLVSSKSGLDVHRATCSDLRKVRTETSTLDVTSRTDLCEEWFGDIAEENGTPAVSYIGEFRFLPCCTLA